MKKIHSTFSDLTFSLVNLRVLRQFLSSSLMNACRHVRPGKKRYNFRLRRDMGPGGWNHISIPHSFQLEVTQPWKTPNILTKLFLHIAYILFLNTTHFTKTIVLSCFKKLLFHSSLLSLLIYISSKLVLSVEDLSRSSEAPAARVYRHSDLQVWYHC